MRTKSGHEEDTLPSAGTWKSLATAPTKRTEVAAAAVGRNIYVVGGFSKPSRLQSIVNRLLNRPDLVVTDVVEEYGALATAGFHGKLFAIAGMGDKGNSAAPEANRCQVMAPMPSARHGLGVSVVNGRLYVLSGGSTPGASYTNVTEMFIPADVLLNPETFWVDLG